MGLTASPLFDGTFRFDIADVQSSLAPWIHVQFLFSNCALSIHLGKSYREQLAVLPRIFLFSNCASMCSAFMLPLAQIMRSASHTFSEQLMCHTVRSERRSCMPAESWL